MEAGDLLSRTEEHAFFISDYCLHSVGLLLFRRKRQVFDPDRGDVRILEAVKRCTEQRISRYAEEHFAGRYTRPDIRFRGQFLLHRRLHRARTPRA
ncbi:MAG: hypothetical protein HY675_23275 [Chloroflexi bacterium]|nr:hypothetical protein [Chloroflexota bacterium]